jgi:SOS response regulatory protein OraA/RecX
MRNSDESRIERAVGVRSAYGAAMQSYRRWLKSRGIERSITEILERADEVNEIEKLRQRHEALKKKYAAMKRRLALKA